MRPAALTLAAATAAALAAPATAHHSMAPFDGSQVVTIEGVVTRYDWSNPHVYIYVAARDDAGATVEWEIEGQPPAILRRQGWSRDTIAVGDRLAVSGNPARNTADKSLYLTGMTKAEADASLFDQGALMAGLMSSGAPPVPATNGLEGMWATLLSLEVILPFIDPEENFALTDAGAAAVAAYDEATMNPGLACIALPAPGFMYIPDVKRIAVEDDLIRIDGEFDGAERVIHLDVATHDGAEPSNQGHSIGRWDGETLVIDTARFAEHAAGNGDGLPSGPRKHLVERLTPTEDRTGLVYSFELIDPDYLAQPVTGEVAWAHRPDLAYAPEPCDLENARRYVE
jgi:hypothetical protein